MQRLFVMAAMLLSACSFSRPPATALVTKVLDGDTVIIVHKDREFRLRLDCIDAPETSQDFGPQSGDALSAAVLNKTIGIKAHEKDRYGRWVSTLYVEGEDINLDQVRRGLAWTYRDYCNNGAYFEAENAAKKAKLGLWTQQNPLPPWLYRRQR